MILDAFIDWITDWFFGLLYKAQAGICYLIDFIKRIFYKLCGLDTVVANGEDVDLVSYLVQSNTIHRVFLTIFLCFVKINGATLRRIFIYEYGYNPIESVWLPMGFSYIDRIMFCIK